MSGTQTTLSLAPVQRAERIDVVDCRAYTVVGLSVRQQGNLGSFLQQLPDVFGG